MVASGSNESVTAKLGALHCGRVRQVPTFGLRAHPSCFLLLVRDLPAADAAAIDGEPLLKSIHA